MESGGQRNLKELLTHFMQIPDPRKRRGLLHPLETIFGIAIIAIICGADDWTDVEEFGKSRFDFFNQLFELKHGIPSHDTFGRVFSMINANAFFRCFAHWTKDLFNKDERFIALDGKQLRGSYDTASDMAAIHIVSAWASDNELVLAQYKVAEKSNEITAIPELLDMLSLSGSIITIDAMRTQRAIAAKIIDRDADYVLSLKENHPELHEQVSMAFQRYSSKRKIKTYEDVDSGHGRIEKRICRVAQASDYLPEEVINKWKGLNTIVELHSQIYYKNGKNEGTEMTKIKYFITSLGTDASLIQESIRSHWGIETKLHWVLDVAFREDHSRVRTGQAAENLAALRHIALNKLKKEKTLKRGIKAKRKKAGWDTEYLIKVLAA